PLPLRQRPGRANESTLLIGISLRADQAVTTVWRTEPGTTLIVGVNSTTAMSAYFRTCAFTSVHLKRPLAPIASTCPARAHRVHPCRTQFLPCMAPRSGPVAYPGLVSSCPNSSSTLQDLDLKPFELTEDAIER